MTLNEKMDEISNYLDYHVPVDVLEVAKILYDTYDGSLKQDRRMSLVYELNSKVYEVWDGIASESTGYLLFSIQARGNNISKIGGTRGVKADSFKVIHGLVPYEETSKVVSQVKNILAGGK